MKKFVGAVIGVACLMILVNGGTPESSTDSPNKQSVNFHGTLETWYGPCYKVEYISFEHRTKISLYEMPAPNSSCPAAVAKLDTADKNPIVDKEAPHVLLKDPTRNFVKTKIDLSEVHAIQIPEPENPWIYKRKGGKQETEYLELVVVANDKEKTKTSYLIESRKKLYCDKVTAAGPEERDVPLAAIKNLTIEGWKHRDEEPKRKQQKNDAGMPAISTAGTRPVA